MDRNSKFFLTIKVLVGVMGSLNLGICTSFILSKGLSFIELSVIYSLILGTSLILEFPSGNLADRYGRKLVYSLGIFATGIQFTFYALFSNVILLYIAAIVAGISDSLISGSLEAWLTQTESETNKKEGLYKIFGLSRSLTSLFSIVISISIGIFLKANIAYVYIAAGIVLFIAAIISIFYLKDNKGTSNRTLDYTYQTIIEFVKSPTLLLLAFILSAAFACYSIFILYWQPMATTFKIPLNKLPLLYSFNLLGVAISSYTFSKYAKKISSNIFLNVSFILLGFSFGLVLFFSNLYTLVATLLIFGLGYGVIIPLFFSWAANTISTHNAASMLSLMNAVASLIAVITTIVIGAIIKQSGIKISLLIGLLLTVFILVGINMLSKLAHHKELTSVKGAKNESSTN